MKVKNIFKKNQIIITALAIMIAIAGYLSFTNKDKPTDELDAIQTANPDENEYDVFSELEGMDVVTDTNNGDGTVADDITNDNNDVLDNDEEADVTADETDDVDATEDEDTVPVRTQDNELGEISDDELLANAQNVTDNGELDLDDGIPGEAVLASNTINASYFMDSKLKREQVRAKNKATYEQIIESPDISEEAKNQAINGLIELISIQEKEDATEMLLGAKGFEDSIVRITDGKVEVVINAANLTEQQLAIIEDVVKSKTEIPIENIGIIPVVMEE
jgi:stage III sporulation protein AH